MPLVMLLDILLVMPCPPILTPASRARPRLTLTTMAAGVRFNQGLSDPR